MISDIHFKRAIWPNDAVDDPILVLFSDGSTEAYGAAAYARWKLLDGSYSARLIAAKSRLAPLKIVHIVRLELCGAVLSKRLRYTIMNEMNITWKEVLHLTDSEIVHAMTQKESYGFNTFAANRVGEIQEGTEKDEWCWVPGKPWLNIADLTTRGAKPSEIDENSVWQNGPAFLSTEEEDWPTHRKARTDIPLPELKQKFIVAAATQPEDSLLNRFALERYSRWRLLVHTTARLIRLYKRFKKDEANLSMQPTADDVKDAERMWIIEAQ